MLARARHFIDQRPAATQPASDGKQTPYRGHPALVAQHATASCCRSCLATWLGIEKGAALTEAEKRRIEASLRRWPPARPGRPTPEKERPLLPGRRGLTI
jgi:hypothetical protein